MQQTPAFSTVGAELDEDVAVAVLTVRYRSLVGLGLAPEQAAVVAADPDLRLMDVMDLVRRGFPARAAIRIVRDGHPSRIHAGATSSARGEAAASASRSREL